MNLPSYEDLMKHLLEVSVHGRKMTLNECVNKIVNKLNIPDELSKKRMPDGKGTVLKNRISWAKTYLSK